MSITISNAAKEILCTFGWYEGRCIELREIKIFLEDHGFSATPIAVEFLRQFHGLRLRPSNQGSLSFIHFDIYEEMSWIEREDKPFLDALVQAPLCPVGHGGGVLLFLTPTAEMVLLNDQWLGFSRLPNIAEGMDLILGICRPPQYDGVSLQKEQVPPGFC
ncbi:MAG: SUKH-3 domain-containing protein [Candidatus Competibacteraceae bacterium]